MWNQFLVLALFFSVLCHYAVVCEITDIWLYLQVSLLSLVPFCLSFPSSCLTLPLFIKPVHLPHNSPYTPSKDQNISQNSCITSLFVTSWRPIKSAGENVFVLICSSVPKPKKLPTTKWNLIRKLYIVSNTIKLNRAKLAYC